MLNFINFLFKTILFFCLFLAAISLVCVANKIGWLNVALGFIILVAYVIIYIILNNREIESKVDENHYNEYMAKLNQEVQRPIIQAKLEKRLNDKDYNPLFPNQKEEDVTLSDVVGSFFDVIRTVVPTKDNPIKADITYTTPKGEDFKINLEIRDKSQK